MRGFCAVCTLCVYVCVCCCGSECGCECECGCVRVNVGVYVVVSVGVNVSVSATLIRCPLGPVCLLTTDSYERKEARSEWVVQNSITPLSTSRTCTSNIHLVAVLPRRRGC